MKYFIVVMLFLGAYAVEFQISNNLQEALWIGVLPSNGHTKLEDGGFVLSSYAQRVVNSPVNWTGSFWARTQCDSHTKLCQTGSCGRKIQCSGAGPVPPVTLVDVKLKSIFNKTDVYGVSLLDGFNVPAQIVPLNGEGECLPSSCTHDLNAKCHEELSVIGSSGDIIGCQSSCNRYYSACCRGQFKNLQTCNASNWLVNSSEYFKYNCPEVYEYSINEKPRNFTCNAQIYSIIFGDRM